MTPELWRKVEELFHAAMERAPEARQAFLEEKCAGDTTLRRRIERLLAREEQAGRFLERQVFADISLAETATPSPIGRDFGPYRILSRLGLGGMGEVYRAHDSKLGRDVALKTLPPGFASDPDGIARIRREARTLASLNHPNIAAIYGLEEFEERTFLVLELVEGETLSERINSGGPLPLREAVGICCQVAEALEAAHSKGIVHRDLKPANIKVTSEGRVKVLDFGLAKAVGMVEEELQRDSNLTTANGFETAAGRILGTPAYMSPEQARGASVDTRTDVWAFGCVLYEILTGKRAFSGETVQSTLAAVLEREPDWQALPANTPACIRELLVRCLRKDASHRLQEIGGARIELQATTQAHPGMKRWQRATAAAGCVSILGAGLLLWMRAPARSLDRSAWVQITDFPDSVSDPAFSPDGRMLTFIRGTSTFISPGDVYFKVMPSGTPVQLTHDNVAKMNPAFSPDGSLIAYTVLSRRGGWDTWVVRPVGSAAPQAWLPNASGLSWVSPQQLLFSEIKSGQHMAIVTASESRAGSRDIYVPPQIRGMAHRSYLSPDGKSVLLVEMDESGEWIPCRVVPFDGRSPGRQVGPVGAGCASGAWSPDGRWVYLSTRAGGNVHIWRQRFPEGTPEQITSGPTEEEGIAFSPDGHSFITSVGSRQRGVWIHDSAGERQMSLEGYAFSPQLTPDGTRLFFRVLQGRSSVPYLAASELWAADLRSGQRELFLPRFAVTNYQISPDGRRVIFSALDRAGKNHLWLMSTEHGSAPRQVPNADGDMPFFGPPGELIFHSGRTAFRIREDGSGRRKAIDSPVDELHGVSPDSGWLIGMSEEGDRALTQAYPLAGGDPIRIGPFWPIRWQRDGKFIYLSVNTARGTAGAFGRTYALPLRPGQMFPRIPAGGFRSEQDLLSVPGLHLVGAPPDFDPGPTPEMYAFSRQSMQRNLFRIPLP